ncbi:MAG TPA: hypothetical protein VGB53_01415 [Rubricoccaceae bacterium]|jgi:hypothetical protein
MLRSVLLVALVLPAVAGCDASSDGTVAVRGRVVDAVTGEALSPGPAIISVRGASFMGETETPLQGEAGADGRFDLSDVVRNGINLETLTVGSAGRIEYPGADTSATAVLFGIGRAAYHPYQTGFRGRRDVGEIRLLPTCLTLGAVRFSRPLAPSEQLRIQTVPVPETPPATLLRDTQFTYEGSSAPGVLPPDSLRLFAVGGRAVQLTWELGQYNPPTGNGQQGIARGSVDLPTCRRHGVLRYAATLVLP